MKNCIDKTHVRRYNNICSVQSGAIKDARVVELADSLDSGSSVHYGRAGSSPASRTKQKDRKSLDFRSFFYLFITLLTLK